MKSDFKTGKEGEFSFCNNGECRYGYYMPIGTRNWQLVYTVKDESVNRTLNNIYRINNKHSLFVAMCYLVWLACIVFYFHKANKEVKNAHLEISKSMEILHIALRHSNQPIFEYNPELKVIKQITDFPNPLFNNDEQSLSIENIITQNIILPQSIVSFMQLFETIKNCSEARADIQINSYGETPWIRISFHNIYKENSITSCVGFIEDITELKIIEQQTKRKLELQDALISKALLYAKADIETNNFLEMNGEESEIPYDEFLQKNIIDRVRPEDKAYVSQELSLNVLRNKFEQGTDTIETQFIMNFNGTDKWVSCLEYCNFTNQSKLIIIISDIDKKKRQEISLLYQAERDGLTGLYNSSTTRAKIEEALSSPLSSNAKQIFILLDLDNYKLINDTFGHDYGNQVLIEVTNSIKNRFRSSDIIGRIGGDEFVIFLRNMNKNNNIDIMLKELCNIISKTYSKDGKEVHLSASIGVSTVPNDGNTFDELFKKSDIALYEVKHQNKNGYRYYENL